MLSRLMTALASLLVRGGFGFSLIFSIGSHAFAQTLKATDVSVLWPLKAGDAKDDLFKTTGDGFCNTIGIQEGTLWPAATFDAFATAVLNASGTTCARDKDLEDAHFLSADEDLVKPDIHLARLKGLTPTVCAPGAWRIVSFRFDPCQNLADVNAGKGQCLPMVRLVAQPFEKGSNGLWNVRDFSAHLIYLVSDVPAVVADLKAFAKVARDVEKKEPWDPSIDATDVLRPHHALRNEMDSCGGTASTKLKSLVLKHAVADRLVKIAWMTSSMGVKEWSFGALDVSNAGTTVTESTVLGQKFDNFSDTLMTQGKPSLNTNIATAPFPNAFAQIAQAALPALPAADLADAARTRNIDALQRILDPTKLTQAQSNCASCHLADQALTRLRALHGKPNAVGSGEYKAAVWPHLVTEPRAFVHLRNFGYGPQFSMGINRRTVNETDAVQKYLTKHHP